MAEKPQNLGKKRGPREGRLVIRGDWEDAVKRAVEKLHPPGGWPKPRNNRATTKQKAKKP